MSRFDYVKYDELSVAIQNNLKERFMEIDIGINGLPDSRAKALAIAKLEEAYMWVGKAIRDDQLLRNPHTDLNEQRES